MSYVDPALRGTNWQSDKNATNRIEQCTILCTYIYLGTATKAEQCARITPNYKYFFHLGCNARSDSMVSNKCLRISLYTTKLS